MPIQNMFNKDAVLINQHHCRRDLTKSQIISAQSPCCAMEIQDLTICDAQRPGFY